LCGILIMKKQYRLIVFRFVFLFLTLTGTTISCVHAEVSQSTFQYVTQWRCTNGNSDYSLPWDITTDSQGNVYVFDCGTLCVQKFSANGEFMSKIDVRQVGVGNSYGIAVDLAGNIYVADFNCVIWKFSPEGTLITHWGSRGTGEGQFVFSWSVAADKFGNIFVADSNSPRIEKFSSDGVFISQWGSWGYSDGQFLFVAGLATDVNGNVYAIDPGAGKIQEFTNDGIFIRSLGASVPNGYDVSVTSAGNIFAVDTGGQVTEFRSDGSLVMRYSSSGSENGQFNTPFGIAADDFGNVYVADTFNHRIQKFYVPSISGISNTVDTNTQNGKIDNQGISQSLNSKLADAQSFISQGNIQNAKTTLNALINEVTRQSGKHIDPQVAQLIINEATALINSL
jgi:hypothetical protein